MVKYLFSNIAGSYVIDNQGKIIKSEISKEPYSNFLKLSEREFTNAEISLAEQFKSEGLVLLQDKKDSKGMKYVENTDLIKKFLDNVRNFEELKAINNEITVRQIKGINSEDHLLVQSVNSIEETDKTINLLTKRLREFCEVYVPEFSRQISNNQKFSEYIVEKSRQELLADLRLDEDKAMGNELKDEDLLTVRALANQINLLNAMREETVIYIEKKMKTYSPNLLFIAGPTIGAKLLAMAGSLKKLAMLPSSTIQLLGAEKALFRHLKTGARCPKHGIISQHQFISKQRKPTQGKAARLLSEKIAISARVDYFKGEFVADKLLADIEKRICADQR